MALEWRKDNLQTLEEKKEKEKKQRDVELLRDAMKALQSAQIDTDVLLVEQEYRVTLLELGLEE